jgi:Tfp pilus assembly protein PilN
VALTIDFARRPFKNLRPVRATIGALLAAGLILTIINWRAYASFRQGQANTRAEISSLRSRLARAEQREHSARQALATTAVGQIAERSRGVNRIVEERRFSWSHLLDRLERVLPDDVRLITLQPGFDEAKDGATLHMTLVGRTPDSSVRTLAALGRDSHFAVLTLANEADPEKGGPEGYRFAVSVEYRPEDAP